MSEADPTMAVNQLSSWPLADKGTEKRMVDDTAKEVSYWEAMDLPAHVHEFAKNYDNVKVVEVPSDSPIGGTKERLEVYQEP